MRKAIVIATILFAALLLSCGSKKQEMGEYVYVDDNNIVHSDKDCGKVSEQSQLVIYSYEEYAKYICIEKIDWSVCAKCGSGKLKDNINQKIEVYNKKKESETQCHREEYEALCAIGKDRWGYFENFHRFIIKKENEDKLDEELEEEGWDVGLLELRLSFRRKSKIAKESPKVLWNNDIIEAFYFKMREAGVNTGTKNDFKKSLADVDDFVWYYKKSLELGLVDSWERFIMLMFEPDCEYCKDELYEQFYQDIEETPYDD